MKFKKRKKKNEFGYFYNFSPGDPKINADMFNHAMSTGDVPIGTPSGPACSEELNEAQKKNTYEILYLNRGDNKVYVDVQAYSEKQAALVAKKQYKDIYRILSIECVEDHSKDDGEQIGLFESDKRPVEGIVILVQLLNLLTGEDYSYLLEKVNNRYVWDIHHTGPSHNNNEFKYLTAIRHNNHSSLTNKKGADLEDYEHLKIGKIILDKLSELGVKIEHEEESK